MNSTFKRIPSHPAYSVDRVGRVFSHKTNKLLKYSISVNGYYEVSLDGKRYKVHRLVYETYIGNLYGSLVVNHVDKDKLNNDVNNLEQISQKDNILHSISDRKYKTKFINIQMIDRESGEVIHKFSDIFKAHEYLGLERNNGKIRECINGKRKHAYGYEWRLEEVTS